MSNVANPPPSSARGLPLLKSTDSQPVIRKALESLTEMQTAFIQLSPAFCEALQSIAPKKRRAKVRWVIAAALLVVVGAIFLDGSTRQFVVERGHALALKMRGATGARSEQAVVAAKVAPAPNALPPISPPAPAAVAPPAVTPTDVPVAKPITTGAPDAKPTKDTRTPAAAPAKRNLRRSTRAPRPAAPRQPASVPATLVASRDSDGF